MTYTKLIERAKDQRDRDAAEHCPAEIIALQGEVIAGLEALQSQLDTAIQSSAHWQHQFTELQAENERLKAEKAGLEHVKNAFGLQMQTLQSKLDAMGKGEPVAFMSPKQLEQIKDPEDESGRYIPLRKTAAGNFVMALYAAPKALAPLTDEQIYFGQWGDGSGSSADFREGARFAERHHGIGGTP